MKCFLSIAFVICLSIISYSLYPKIRAKYIENEAFLIVIVKTCSDNVCTIGQKKCPMFVAKIRNYFHSHNQMLQ